VKDNIIFKGLNDFPEIGMALESKGSLCEEIKGNPMKMNIAITLFFNLDVVLQARR